MTEEYKHGDDHDVEPYDMPTIPFHHSNSPGEHKSESDATFAQERITEPQPLTQGPSSSGHDDTTQVFNPPYFSQAAAVPFALPPTPRKKRGLQLSPRNIVLLALIVLLVLGGAAGIFIYYTRSTPDKTLDAFCSALVKNNAGAAYQQFAPALQRTISRQALASTLAHSNVTQCTYMQVNEGPASVQTDLTLRHSSRGTNNDRVTLGKDAQGTWRITDINVARPQRVPRQAIVHHMTLSARQIFSKAAMVFAANGGGTGTGLAVAAGSRVVIIATGNLNIVPGNNQVEASGTSVCPKTTLPVSGLNCYAAVYSLGSINQVAMVGGRADFTTQTAGMLFLGLNTPEQSQTHGSFKLTILVIPDGTATGVWEQPESNGFLFSQATETFTLSALVFAQNYANHISHIRFYLLGSGGSRTSICDEPYDGASEVVNCQWDRTVNGGTPISNGPVKIGFSLLTDNGQVNDPDGIISGIVRYIATQRSYNYAGYSAQSISQPQPTHYRSSAMSWTVPAVHCTPGEESDAALWAGLTGTSEKSQIAQLGTDSGCLGGSAFYYPWWEMYPAPSNLIDNPLQPGDKMVATVTYQQGRFRLTLENMTENWRFTTVQGGSDSDTLIAECVVEAPAKASDLSLVRLSNFGSVSINCLANNQPIGEAGPQNVIYQMAGSQQQAITSDLDQRGANFTVKWGSR